MTFSITWKSWSHFLCLVLVFNIQGALSSSQERHSNHSVFLNGTDSKTISLGDLLRTTQLRTSNLGNQIATKGFLGMDSASVMGVIGPLALAAMVTLPFMAPAAAALLPLAGLSSVFGRRRRHLGDEVENTQKENAMRRWEQFNQYLRQNNGHPHRYDGKRNAAQKKVEELVEALYDSLRKAEKS